MLEQGAVVISLDTELGWGYHGFDGGDHLSTTGDRERRNVHGLLDLFERYDAPVTWAVVGHLFLDECDGAHTDLPTPSYNAVEGDWYDDDPGTSRSDSPLRYGRDLVESIIASPIDHEIATHTFSHILCDRPECSQEVLRTELSRCRKLAAELDIELSTLVFPRNEVALLETVEAADITVYRDFNASQKRRLDTRHGKLLSCTSFYLHRSAPVAHPERVSDGLWRFPSSMDLTYSPDPLSLGLDKALPTHPRIKRGQRTIDHAKRIGGYAHFNAHPHNFDEELFAHLEAILQYAVEVNVPVVTMQEAVSRWTAETSTNNR